MTKLAKITKNDSARPRQARYTSKPHDAPASEAEGLGSMLDPTAHDAEPQRDKVDGVRTYRAVAPE